MAETMVTHSGCCHCGAVAFEVEAPARITASDCNCSICRMSGYLHLIAEDYGMLHFQSAALDPREFWHEVAPNFAAGTNTDLFIGRNIFSILEGMNFERRIISLLRAERPPSSSWTIKPPITIVNTVRAETQGLRLPGRFDLAKVPF